MDLEEKIKLMDEASELMKKLDKFHSDCFEKGRKEYIIPMTDKVFDNLPGYDNMSPTTKQEFNQFKRKAEAMVDFMLACQGLILRHNRVYNKVELVREVVHRLIESNELPMEAYIVVEELYNERDNIR